MLVPTSVKRVFLDEADIEKVLGHLAEKILNCVDSPERLLLIGVIPYGAVLAHRIACNIKTETGVQPYVGSIDVAMEPDTSMAQNEFKLNRIDLPVSVDGYDVVVVDDVVQSGRTAAAAFALLERLGTPASINLAVLADRGDDCGLVRGDYVGESVSIAVDEDIVLYLEEIDGFSEMVICRK